MSLICVTSAKGAPGVTLTALGLAAALPCNENRRKVLLEADPSGGSLAIRFGLGRQPGMLSLAGAGGHGLAEEDIWAHVQELPGGLGVICAPERSDRARAILNPTAITLGSWLAGLDGITVVADCGRYTPADPASGLVEAATQVLMVARPTAEQVQPAAAAAQHLAAMGVAVAWVLIGERPHSAAEVASVTGIPVARVLPDDQRGAELLASGNASARRANRLARHFASWAHEFVEQPTTEAEAQPTIKPIEAPLAEVTL